MPGVGCWKQCAACTTGHVIQNHESDSCEGARAQVVVVQDAVGVTRTCSAHDEAFKSSVPTPAERWETSDDTASGPSCQDSVTQPTRAAPGLVVGVLRVLCNGLCTARRFHSYQEDQRCRMECPDEAACVRHYDVCPRLFQYLFPFGLRRKRAHVATVSSTTSY